MSRLIPMYNRARARKASKTLLSSLKDEIRNIQITRGENSVEMGILKKGIEKNHFRTEYFDVDASVVPAKVTSLTHPWSGAFSRVKTHVEKSAGGIMPEFRVLMKIFTTI